MNFEFAPREIRIASADGATTTLNVHAARIENVAKTYSRDAYTDSVADVVRYIQELNDGVIYTLMQNTAMQYIDAGYRPDSIRFHYDGSVENTPEDDELTGAEELI